MESIQTRPSFHSHSIILTTPIFILTTSLSLTFTYHSCMPLPYHPTPITMLIIHPQYPHYHAPIYHLPFFTTPHSMHGCHPHPSPPSLFLSLATILIPHPRARNLVDSAAHHAHVQLASTGIPKAARLHACVPCTQAAPSLIFLLCMRRQQGPCSSPATITRSSHAGIRASRHGGNISWMPRGCRRCSSLHGAADVGSLPLKRISRRRGKP